MLRRAHELVVKRLSTNQRIAVAVERALHRIRCAPQRARQLATRRFHQLGLVWTYADYLLDRYAIHSPWCVVGRLVPGRARTPYTYDGSKARAEHGRMLLLGAARTTPEGCLEAGGTTGDHAEALGEPYGPPILPAAVVSGTATTTTGCPFATALVGGQPAALLSDALGSLSPPPTTAAHMSQIDEVVEANFPCRQSISGPTASSSRGQVEIERDPTSGTVRIIYSRGASTTAPHIPADMPLVSYRHGYPDRNYTRVRAAIGAAMKAPEDFDDGLFGPILVRLAWHCCATYDRATDTGGSNGLTMRLVPEITDDGNTGLHTARAVLQPIKQQFPWITYADLWTLAGVVAVESMGGPQVPWTPGRVDCCNDQYVPPNGRLPLGYKDAEYIRAKFDALCLDDRGIVAIMGAHALGRCHRQYSGWDGQWTRTPTVFSNQFFKALLEEEWEEGAVPETGRVQFYNKDRLLMMLNTDMELVRDAGFARWVEAYAADEQRFFGDFSRAFGQLLELGVVRGADGIARDKK